jgi:hypothetical protein
VGIFQKYRLAGKFQKHLGGNNFKKKGENILAGTFWQEICFFFTFKTLQNAPFLNKCSET